MSYYYCTVYGCNRRATDLLISAATHEMPLCPKHLEGMREHLTRHHPGMQITVSPLSEGGAA